MFGFPRKAWEGVDVTPHSLLQRQTWPQCRPAAQHHKVKASTRGILFVFWD